MSVSRLQKRGGSVFEVVPAFREKVCFSGGLVLWRFPLVSGVVLIMKVPSERPDYALVIPPHFQLVFEAPEGAHYLPLARAYPYRHRVVPSACSQRVVWRVNDSLWRMMKKRGIML